MSALCQQCGSELQKQFKICDFCGYPVDGKYFTSTTEQSADSASSVVVEKKYRCTECKKEYSKAYKFCPACRGKVVAVKPNASIPPIPPAPEPITPAEPAKPKMVSEAEELEKTADDYRDGTNGKKKSPQKALEYYTKAAALFKELGNKRKAAVCCNNAGVEEHNLEHYSKEIEWYEKGFELDPDFVWPYKNLADNYSNGEGVKVNHKKAAELYAKAAELFGKQGDKKEAAECFNKAGIQEHNLEHYSKEIECYEKAIEVDPDFACLYKNLADNYSNGEGVKVNHKKAIELYAKAAELFEKHGEADEAAKCCNSAGLQENELGHYSKENAWYKRALEYDPRNPDAPRNLAINYQNGDGVGIDFKKAAKYYILADKNGNSDAASDLSEIGYEKYDGKWLSVREIAEIYEDEEDYSKASIYFEKAYQTQEKEGNELEAGLSCLKIACCAKKLDDNKSVLSWGKKALDRLPEEKQLNIVLLFKSCGFKKQENGEWGIPTEPVDFAIKASSFDFNGKRFTVPNVKSLNTMLRRFSENVMNSDDAACWCKNGVQDDCDGNCRSCILCSNNGIPQEKILAFTSFCNWLEKDPDLCKKILIPKY